MKKNSLFMVLLFTAFFLWTGPASGGNINMNDELMKELAKNNNSFALKLFRNLTGDKSPEHNIFFSPLSITSAMAITYTGARGKTREEMKKVLCFTLSQKELPPAFWSLTEALKRNASKKSYELNMANALWGQKGFHFQPEFLGLIKKYFDGGFFQVDFKRNPEGARESINAWVEKKTRNRIKELLKPGNVTTLTRLIITNAIYFKGNWASMFKKENTEKAPFFTPAGEKKVPMMKQTGKFRYAEERGKLQILELPYEGNDLSMVILLPSRRTGLKNLERNLTAENLNSWLSRMYKRKVVVYLPKFKINSRFLLSQAMIKMGMPTAFSERADFSGITGERNIFISEAIHQAYVNVNEEGTEAAAATAVTMLATAIPTPPPVFRADHPFIFLIIHKSTGTILFMGLLSSP